MLAPCCGCLNVVRLNDSCALRQADITDEARRQIEMRRQDKCYEWKAAVISGTLRWGWLLSMVVLLLAGSSSAHRALVYLSIVYALLGALQGGVLLAVSRCLCAVAVAKRKTMPPRSWLSHLHATSLCTSTLCRQSARECNAVVNGPGEKERHEGSGSGRFRGLPCTPQ